MNEAKMTEFQIRRANFVKPFQGNRFQAELIPDIAKELFKRQFRVSIDDHRTAIPIVFSTCWKYILQFVKSQPSPEFSISICGVILEYITEYSESDKPTNIIPRMIYNPDATPKFHDNESKSLTAAAVNNGMLEDYNSFRSSYIAEVLDKVETETENEIRTKYGIHLIHTVAVLPMVAAVQVAGIQVAIEEKKTVNMYSLFEIDANGESEVILTPLAAIKQGLKDDNKKQ